MRTIYKATLGPERTVVEMPLGSRTLFAREQRGHVCLWYLCDPTEPKVKRTFFCTVTGGLVDPAADHYVGSALLQDGDFVIHVFELLQPAGPSQ